MVAVVHGMPALARAWHRPVTDHRIRITRMPHLAVILLSGGLDSATTAAVAAGEGFELFALSIDYGQRHRHELAAARAVGESVGVKRHVTLEIDLRQFGTSA